MKAKTAQELVTRNQVLELWCEYVLYWSLCLFRNCPLKRDYTWASNPNTWLFQNCQFYQKPSRDAHSSLYTPETKRRHKEGQDARHSPLCKSPHSARCSTPPSCGGDSGWHLERQQCVVVSLYSTWGAVCYSPRIRPAYTVPLGLFTTGPSQSLAPPDTMWHRALWGFAHTRCLRSTLLVLTPAVLLDRKQN